MSEHERNPLPPEVLANALQDVVHVEKGESRPARSVKVTPKPAVDLEAMRVLAEKATPGPWEDTWDQVAESSTDDEVAVAGPDGRLVVGLIWYDGHHTACHKENAAFIAAARAFVPQAIEELRELRAALAYADDTIRLTQEAMDGWRERAEKAQADLSAMRKDRDEASRLCIDRRTENAALRNKMDTYGEKLKRDLTACRADVEKIEDDREAYVKRAERLYDGKLADLAAANARADAAEKKLAKYADVIQDPDVFRLRANHDAAVVRADAAEAALDAFDEWRDLAKAAQAEAGALREALENLVDTRFDSLEYDDAWFKARAALGAKGGEK